MVVLAFAAQFPEAARRLLSISGSRGRLAVRDRAALGAARGHHCSDPDWQDGQYAARRAAASPACAWRASSAPSPIARPPSGAALRRGEPIRADDWRRRTPLCRRVRRRGLSRGAGRSASYDVFDPNCYLYLSRAMDRFDLAEHGGSGGAVPPRAACDAALVIGVETDMLFSVDRAAGRRAGSSRPAWPRASRRCPASRGTTRSWWTWRPSGARSVRF